MTPTDHQPKARKITACPNCAQRLGVPANSGHLRITCTACRHQFEYTPDNSAPITETVMEAVIEPASAKADEKTTKEPGNAAGKSGLAIILLLAATFYSLLAAAFLPDPEAAPTVPGLVFMGLGCIALYAFYRGIRILVGSGVFVSIIAALVVSSILGIAGMQLSPQLTGLIQTRKIAFSADEGPQDSAGGDYFTGINANNTTASELDALMEDW